MNGPRRPVKPISIFLILIFTFGTASAQQADDLWSGINVDLNFVLKTINQESCAKSFRSYLGCALGVQAFAKSLKQKLEVIPTSQLNGRQPIISAEKLALVVITDQKTATYEELYNKFENRLSHLTLRYQEAADNFAKHPNKDFEILLNEIIAKSDHPIKSFFYVNAVSNYLQIAFDPHISIYPIKYEKSRRTSEGKSITRLGISWLKTNAGIMVNHVAEGSGADEAGIKPKDILISINGKKIENSSTLNSEWTENMVVELKVKRGSAVKDVLVVIKKFINRFLTAEQINFQGKSILYISLKNFEYLKICSELSELITDWEKKDISGYVLDLRNNPGGYVSISACVAGFFLGNDKVLAYREKSLKNNPEYMIGKTIATVSTKKPLSVIVDNSSASASELVAAAIRDYNRGFIIGQRTFGKGSTQEINPFSNNLVIWRTQGRFLAPSGKSHQNIGITPHISVYVNKEPSQAEVFALREKQKYLFPLPPRNMENPPTGNWDQLKVPEKCMKRFDLETMYKRDKSKDYQLLNALAAVVCTGQD